ncbi:hypothetical protein JKP88DRAFT_247853 [Tribonema minus]|uniref:Uncharacterized protein n=1 Tax=Tribonema minus TaxID=303371 RepID=A0A836CAU0_9STRA|nr:hypothetical protein JKP88DRAFT_247853 [Tribonema minus]
MRQQLAGLTLCGLVGLASCALRGKTPDGAYVGADGNIAGVYSQDEEGGDNAGPEVSQRKLPTVATALPPLPRGKLKWADEFNGDTINESIWEFYLGNPFTNGELQSYERNNVFIDNGSLIGTQEAYSITYGHIEIRMKIAAGLGTWPSIYMLPDPMPGVYGNWPASGEIDIFEAVDNGKSPHATLHYGGAFRIGNKGQNGCVLDNNLDYSLDYHVYTLSWTPGYIAWGIDGRTYCMCSTWFSETLMAENNAGAPYDVRFTLMFNLAIGGNWPQPPSGAGPWRMAFDYVRVYELDATQLPQVGETSRFRFPGAVKAPLPPELVSEIPVAYNVENASGQLLPWQIPLGIDAESFDVGGQGIAYFDNTPNFNSGNSQYRPYDGVDLSDGADTFSPWYTNVRTELRGADMQDFDSDDRLSNPNPNPILRPYLPFTNPKTNMTLPPLYACDPAADTFPPWYTNVWTESRGAYVQDFDNGEWLSYTVYLAKKAVLNGVAVVARDGGGKGQFLIVVDTNDCSGNVNKLVGFEVEATSRMDFKNVNWWSPLELGAGTHRLVVCSKTNGNSFTRLNVNWDPRDGTGGLPGGVRATPVAAAVGPIPPTPPLLPATLIGLVSGTPITRTDGLGMATVRVDLATYDYVPGGQNEGVHYHDVDTVNQSNSGFRPAEGPDASPNAVGWVALGEYMEYTITYFKAGIYKVLLEAAGDAIRNGGTFRMDVFANPGQGGTPLATGILQHGSTVDYNDYQSTTALESIALPAGPFTVRITVTKSGVNVRSLTFVQTGMAPVAAADPNAPTPAPTQVAAATAAPTAARTPLTINLASYDYDTYTGAVNEGKHYHDVDPANQANGGYRMGEGVDAVSDNVGWVAAGEWTQYTVTSFVAGVYKISLLATGLNTGGKYQLDFLSARGDPNAAKLRASITFTHAKTSGWNDYKLEVGSAAVDVPAGPWTLRLTTIETGLNVRSLLLEPVTATGGVTAVTVAPALLTINLGNYDYDDGAVNEGKHYHDTDNTNLASTTYRPKEGPDAVSDNIGWFAVGEWVQYTIPTFGAGMYKISLSATGPDSGGQFQLDFLTQRGNPAAARLRPGIVISHAKTSSWIDYRTEVVNAAVDLPAGPWTLRITVLQGGLNHCFTHASAGCCRDVGAHSRSHRRADRCRHRGNDDGAGGCGGGAGSDEHCFTHASTNGSAYDSGADSSGEHCFTHAGADDCARNSGAYPSGEHCFTHISSLHCRTHPGADDSGAYASAEHCFTDTSANYCCSHPGTDDCCSHPGAHDCCADRSTDHRGTDSGTNDYDADRSTDDCGAYGGAHGGACAAINADAESGRGVNEGKNYHDIDEKNWASTDYRVGEIYLLNAYFKKYNLKARYRCSQPGPTRAGSARANPNAPKIRPPLTIAHAKTTGWNDYVLEVGDPSEVLPAGPWTLRITVLQTGLNLRSLIFEPIGKLYQFNLAAYDMDAGGQAVNENKNYHDTDAANMNGAAYRGTEGVDAVYNSVGYLEVGEWTQYTVDATFAAGTYKISLEAAGDPAFGGGTLKLDFFKARGANTPGVGTVRDAVTLQLHPATASWGTYVNMKVYDSIIMPQGPFTLRSTVVKSGLNLRSLTFMPL